MNQSPSISPCSFARAALLCILVAVTAGTDGKGSPSPEESRPLEVKKPIENTLAGGQRHRYSIKLSAGEFARILVEQRGADVVVVLSDPTEQKIAEIDNRQTERGVESVSLVAAAAGNYLVEVQSLDQEAPAGSYEIRIDQLFTATEREQKLAEADVTLSAGNELFARHTKQSTAQAMEKYSQALSLAETAGDWQLKAIVLHKLGKCSYSLGDYQKAADYELKALELTRTTGDRHAEASALTQLGAAYRLIPESQKALDYLNE